MRSDHKCLLLNKYLIMKNKSAFYHFAKSFNLEQEDLYLVYSSPTYHTFEIPKRNGDLRTIFAPAPNLKKLQRKIAEKLSKYYSESLPDSVMGFVKTAAWKKKRDIVSNARKHRKSKYLINIDIENFFPSIKTEHVAKVLNEIIKLDNEGVQIIRQILMKDDSLPPGSPASPILSNLVFKPIDLAIEHFCRGEKIIYTRYVDDMTFSSKKEITKTQICTIVDILTKHNFRVNEDKTVIYKKNDIKEITGIAIIDKKLALCESTIDEIKSNIHYYKEWKQQILRQYGSNESVRKKISHMQRSIKGQLNFAKRIDGEKGEKYNELKELYEHSLDEKEFAFKVYI